MCEVALPFIREQCKEPPGISVGPNLVTAFFGMLITLFPLALFRSPRRDLQGREVGDTSGGPLATLLCRLCHLVSRWQHRRVFAHCVPGFPQGSPRHGLPRDSRLQPVHHLCGRQEPRTAISFQVARPVMDRGPVSRRVVNAKLREPGQVYIFFIFPGLSFGADSCGSRSILEKFSMTAALAVANSLDDHDFDVSYPFFGLQAHVCHLSPSAKRASSVLAESSARRSVSFDRPPTKFTLYLWSCQTFRPRSRALADLKRVT